MNFNTWRFFATQEKLEPQIYLKNDACIILKDYGDYCESASCSIRDGHIYGVEIEALSKEQACDIVDILCACHTVVCGYFNESSNDIVRRFDKDLPDWIRQIEKKEIVYGGDDLFYACQFAEKVYGNQRFENAVCKYYVAKEIYPLDPMRLDPAEDPFVSEYLLSEQIKIANVIIDCYAVLEELHLQIKVHELKEKYSVTDGAWNPVVKSELETRLQEKGIITSTTIPWLARNNVERPFKSVVNKETLCEWSDGEEIRDFEISICDAILELSYMRSQLASHMLGEKVLKLSVYDAENAFALARRMLLNYFKINFAEITRTV